MDEAITLRPMTAEMYREYFRDYQNDPDIYLDKSKYEPFVCRAEWVERYIRRQADLGRLPFAIMRGEEMIGELKIYDIVSRTSAAMGIAMRSARYKDHGYGTRAERLAVEFVFRELDIPMLYADAIVTNTRSQHVLEKVGFRLIDQDAEKRYYVIERDRNSEDQVTECSE